MWPSLVTEEENRKFISVKSGTRGGFPLSFPQFEELYPNKISYIINIEILEITRNQSYKHWAALPQHS